MTEIGSDIKKFTIIQILDYVHSNVHNEYVSRSLMKDLKIGVENICNKAFGEENTKLIRREVPKIIRASLDARQMGIGGKILKFFDTRRRKRSDEIYNLFSEILSRDKAIGQTINKSIISDPWSERIKKRKKEAQKISH